MHGQYHKINSIWKRGEKGAFLRDEFARPEFHALYKVPIWTATEKVDGTNIRVFINPAEDAAKPVTFGGKTDKAQLPVKLVESLENHFLHNDVVVQAIQETFDGPVTLYGEGYGAGIQSGGVYRDDQDLILFDVRIGDLWLKREDVEDIGAKIGLDVVPIVAKSATLETLVAGVANGFYSTVSQNEDQHVAEGVVARTEPELRDRRGNRIITKVKHEDFD